MRWLKEKAGQTVAIRQPHTRGVQTTYSYDSLNRLVSESYPGASTPGVSYTYCNPGSCGVTYGVGQLISTATSAGNSTNYTAYDPFGQVLASNQVIGGHTYPFAYTYGFFNTDSLTEEDYPSGRHVQLGYGYAVHPQSVTGTYNNQNSTYIAWFDIGPLGELARSLGAQNALVWNRSVNNRMQTVGLTLSDWSHADNSPIYTQFQQNNNYGGSNNGNLQSSNEFYSAGRQSVPAANLVGPLNQSCSYDGVNRLSSMADSSYARGMCYDAYGNSWVNASTGQWAGNTPSMLGTACSSGSTPYSSNTKNQLNGVSYDAAGNQTYFGGNNVSYDAENRVVSVQNSAGVVLASHQYDGEGNRIAKTTASGTTSYIHDVFGRLATEYVNGGFSKDYVLMRSSHIGVRGELVAIENAAGNGSPCATCFVLADDLGSVRMLADASGNVVARHDYLPFGEEAIADGNRLASAGFAVSDSSTQRFTGKERDSESGLDFFGARYYGSVQGRFTSADHPWIDQHPENPQSWNLYAYARNSPLINIDPTGLGCVTDLGQGSDQNHETVELNNSISSDACTGQHGTWVPGDVGKGNIGAYRDSDGNINFQVTTNTGGNVYYSSFVSGAQTDANGVGPGASIAHASADWLSGQIVGSGSLDQMMSFAARRMQPRGGGDLMALLAGPGFSLDAPDNWAGPGGMGTPQGQGDWAAMAHDYNFLTNGITIGSYFNPFISRATAKALIQSDNNLIGHAGGAQAVKMGMLFGVVNAFQWLIHPF